MSFKNFLKRIFPLPANSSYNQTNRIISKIDQLERTIAYRQSQQHSKNPVSEHISNETMVKLAYNLILGREPENDAVLKTRFTDYQDLRQKFLDSEEFKQMLQKENNQVVANLDISETYISDKRFLWCVNNDAKDPISEYARQGRICIEPGLFALFNQSGTFLDIGANIGAFTLPFAANGWRGYSFEASSKNAFALESSIALNNFDVEVVKTAIWDKKGKIYFMQSGPYGLVSNEFHEKSGATFDEIECMSLDDWMSSFKELEKIDFIKIDIEGSEVRALQGMKRFLDKTGYPPIFIECNAFTLGLQGETKLSMLSTAYSIGYEAYELRGGALYKVNVDLIPDKVVSDFLLIKEFPSSMKKHKIVEETQIPDSDKIDHVISRLSDRSAWEHCDPYVCLALKDYPALYSHPEIHRLLTEIAEERDGDLFLEMCIRWFVEQNSMTA